MPVRAERRACARGVPESCRCPRASSRGRSTCARQPDLLARWIEQYGSPLNLLDPHRLARNAGELQWEADRVGADLSDLLRPQGEQGAHLRRRGPPHRAGSRRRERARAAAGARARHPGRRPHRDRGRQAARPARAVRGGRRDRDDRQRGRAAAARCRRRARRRQRAGRAAPRARALARQAAQSLRPRRRRN